MMQISRRKLLGLSGFGLGHLVLADLLGGRTLYGAKKSTTSHVPIYGDLRARTTHFPAPAKAVIQLIQNGGPSQMDLFDPKPELTRLAGKPHPDGVEIHQR